MARFRTPPVTTEPLARRVDPAYLQPLSAMEAVKLAPYKPGDVVWAQHFGGLKRTLIVSVRAYRELVGRYFPRYVVQFVDIDGGRWMDESHTIFPSNIRLGYYMAATEGNNAET